MFDSNDNNIMDIIVVYSVHFIGIPNIIQALFLKHPMNTNDFYGHSSIIHFMDTFVDFVLKKDLDSN